MRRVESKDVTPINDGQTIIIVSHLCNESFCYGLIAADPICNICKSTNLEFVKRKCREAGFPTDFIVDSTDKDGVCYIIPAALTKSIAIAVEETKADDGYELKLSRCAVSHWEPIRGYKNKLNEQSENEMF